MVRTKWTPDGERRLREKTQRYISPAFLFDSERRVTKLINVALTALPATHGTQALVAARENVMAEDNAKAMADIMKAVGMDPAMPAKVAKALGLEAGATIEDINTAIQNFAEMAKKVEDLVSGKKPDDAAEEPAAEEAPAAEAAPPAEDPEKPEVMAAAASMVRLSGKASLAEALRDYERCRKIAAEADAAAEKLATERAALDAGERVALCRRLVADFGARPFQVWANDGIDVGNPGGIMGGASLEVLRDCVAKLSSVGGKKAAAVKPPTTDASGLDERELVICKQTGCDPKTFAALKARRNSARVA
jgi:hypothetical protein